MNDEGTSEFLFCRCRAVSCVFCATFERRDSAEDDNCRRAPRQLLSGPLRRAQNRSLAPFTLRQTERGERLLSIDRLQHLLLLADLEAWRLRSSRIITHLHEQKNKQTSKPRNIQKHNTSLHRQVLFFFFLLLTRVSHHRARCMVAPRGERNKLCTRL